MSFVEQQNADNLRCINWEGKFLYSKAEVEAFAETIGIMPNMVGIDSHGNFIVKQLQSGKPK